MSDTAQQLTDAAIELAHENGLASVSLADVCGVVDIPPGSFARIAGLSFTDFLLELLDAGHIGPPVPCTKARVEPRIMWAHVLNVAVDMAQFCGYQNVRQFKLAERSGTSKQVVSTLIPEGATLPDEIMRAAVAAGAVDVVAQGLAANDPIALDAPEALRRRAVRAVGVRARGRDV